MVDLERVVEFAPDAVLIIGGHGQILLANAAAERVFGYPREELLGQSVEMLVPERFRQAHMVDRGRYGSDPHTRPMGSGLNIVARHREGGEFPVDISLSPMGSGATIAIVRDVSERKRMEMALWAATDALEKRVAELRTKSGVLQSILDGMGDGVVVFNQNGQLTTINPAARRLYPKARQNTQLAEWAEAFDLFLPDKVTPFPSEELPMIRVLRGEAVDGLEVFIRHPDVPDGIWTSVTARPLRDGSGVVTGGVLVIRDNTARKFAEGALLAGQEAERKRVSRELHDSVSQTLCSLILDVEMLRHELPAGASAIRERIDSHQEKLTELSEDVGRVARRLHPSVLERLGLRQAMEQLCTEFSEREGVQVRFSHQQLSEPISTTVALCLYRVAQESLRNIVHHAQTRQAAVTLAGIDGGIHLSIEDAGIGFDPEAVQGKARLGLVSIEERVRLVGGRVAIHSQPGSGTRIEVRVPVGTEPRTANP
ncbi:MAG: PAS domain S-box protein [Acidobacteriia bacterium]|nr:PAS domain S-box protein [Terriglobia bacterium]